MPVFSHSLVVSGPSPDAFPDGEMRRFRTFRPHPRRGRFDPFQRFGLLGFRSSRHSSWRILVAPAVQNREDGSHVPGNLENVGIIAPFFSGATLKREAVCPSKPLPACSVTI